MIHAFILVVLLGDKPISQDMAFRSIERCNYFAAQVIKNYGNYEFSYLMPEEHKRTAYCKPILIDENYEYLY